MKEVFLAMFLMGLALLVLTALAELFLETDLLIGDAEEENEQNYALSEQN